MTNFNNPVLPGDPREERLPKWAQSKLDVLRMRLAEERARLAIGADESTVFVDPYADQPRGLGIDPTVEFQVPDTERSRHRYFQVRRNGDDLYVTAQPSLVVRPQASNAVKIVIEES